MIHRNRSSLFTKVLLASFLLLASNGLECNEMNGETQGNEGGLEPQQHEDAGSSHDGHSPSNMKGRAERSLETATHEEKEHGEIRSMSGIISWHLSDLEKPTGILTYAALMAAVLLGLRKPRTVGIMKAHKIFAFAALASGALHAFMVIFLD